jgi:integrase
MFQRSGPSTLGAYARDYGLFREVCPGTVRQLVIAADLFERWSGGPIDLQDLDEKSVSLWIRDLSIERAPATVRSKRNAILILWRAAADDDLCQPPRRKVRAARALSEPVDCWTVDEVRAICEACRGLQRNHPCGLRRSAWWELAVRVAWDTALRRGDQFRLEVGKVEPTGRAVIVQHKTSRPQPIRLADETLELLRRTLVTVPRGLVCPWTASIETFGDQFSRIVQRAGVREGTWKWLRRASITDCEAQKAGAGGPQGGHAPGSRITALSYVNPRIVAGPDPVRPRVL